MVPEPRRSMGSLPDMMSEESLETPVEKSVVNAWLIGTILTVVLHVSVMLYAIFKN